MIESCIRAFTNYQQDDWNILLPDFELGLNASKSDASGLSPMYIDTGIEPFIPTDITYDTAVNKSVGEIYVRKYGKCPHEGTINVCTSSREASSICK